MAEIVFALCALLSVACAALLFRSYLKGRSQLLLWSSLCFSLLALNNVVLFVDMIIFPTLDFGGSIIRVSSGAIAGALLLYGLIWEMT